MSSTAATHEGFMNGSRMILPRVGEGVGGGCGFGFRDPIQDQSAYLTVGAGDWTWR